MYFSQFSLENKASKANSQRLQDQQQVVKFGWDLGEVKCCFFHALHLPTPSNALREALHFQALVLHFFTSLRV